MVWRRTCRCWIPTKTDTGLGKHWIVEWCFTWIYSITDAHPRHRLHGRDYFLAASISYSPCTHGSIPLSHMLLFCLLISRPPFFAPHCKLCDYDNRWLIVTSVGVTIRHSTKYTSSLFFNVLVMDGTRICTNSRGRNK